MKTPLDHALRLHQAGQLPAAIGAYQAMLSEQPGNPQVLHLLGTALLQTGDLGKGSGFLRKSLEIAPRNPSALNNLGIALKDLGRLDEALGCFDESILLEPGQADAHANRGAILRELDRLDEALASYDRAIALKPAHAEAHCNRGNALRKLGRFGEALASYDEVLSLKPDHVEAHWSRGHALQALKRHQEALACFDKAILLRPDRADMHVDRALVLRALRRLDEALASIDRALSLRPGHAQSHDHKGSILAELKRLDPAMASFDQALALDPGRATVHSNRGMALKELGRWSEALASFDQAISLAPGFADACNNKGGALFALGRPDEALACFEKAMALDPGRAMSHANRGAALQALGRLDDASASYDRAIELDPSYPEGYLNKSSLLLLRGDLPQGWALYEWRLKKDDIRSDYPRFPKPAWRGHESLRGKRILVHSEQGFGDVLQFCRYLPRLGALGAEIVFAAPRALVSIVSTLKCEMTVIAQGDPPPGFDVYCPVMSLPLAFGTTVATIPSATPYLFADPAKVSAWRERLGPATRPRVGLAWSGSTTHKNDLHRSIGLEALIPLLDLPVEWHALQKEFRRHDMAALDRHPEVHRHPDEIADFSDTAALAECMDLVISVDTSVAHLAGAIGKQVWILLPHLPDFRWMLDRPDSPWYPTASLFRQPRPGDWATVVDRVRERLLEMGGVHPEALDVNGLFRAGVALHQQGQLAAAKGIYERVLAVQPGHFDARHLRGVLAYQARDPEAAARWIAEAIAIKPDVAAAYSNRGLALQDLGAVEEALASFDRAIDLQPDHPDAHSNRGNALLGLGRPNEALASFDKAIDLRPDFADAHSNRGNALCALGRLEDALAGYDRAIALRPDHAGAIANRGHALRALGLFDAALASYEQALALRPDDPDALSGLGCALRELRRQDEALACFDRVLALHPGHAQTWSRRGNALQDRGRHADALASYDRALAVRPGFFEAWSNRGMALLELGRQDDAIASFDKAIELEPGHADAHWNKSLALLSLGRFAAGWALHEWRWKRGEAARSRRDFKQALWLGAENLCGKTILLHAEQGLGDTLQFCRYARWVGDLGATVLFEAPRPLLRLLQGLGGVHRWVERGQPLPDFDFHCPLMSLPLAFGTGLGTIPSPGPYLGCQADQREAWRRRLGEKSGLRVGIAWSGSPTHHNDRKRSLSLARLMAQLPAGLEYVSLQKDVREDDGPALVGSGIRHFGDELTDFSETAALCDLMDVVVSVDTSVAHLAGAMGKPAWVLLPHLPDWRWLLAGEYSPWYRSARLYRQGEDRQWEPVLERVAHDLGALLAKS